MSVSALISQFSNSTTDSPPQSPDITARGSLSQRHYSTSSVGSSRSDSPASTGSRSPHPDVPLNRHMSAGNDARPQPKLGSITEDRIRMYKSQCGSTDTTDSSPRSPSTRRVATRQMSAGTNEPPRGTGLKGMGKRQLSAGSCPGATKGRSPSPFKLPGLATAAGGECREGREREKERGVGKRREKGRGEEERRRREKEKWIGWGEGWWIKKEHKESRRWSSGIERGMKEA